MHCNLLVMAISKFMRDWYTNYAALAPIEIFPGRGGKTQWSVNLARFSNAKVDNFKRLPDFKAVAVPGFGKRGAIGVATAKLGEVTYLLLSMYIVQCSNKYWGQAFNKASQTPLWR